MIVEKGVPGSTMGSSNAKGNALAEAVEAAGFACTATPAGFREVRSTPVCGIGLPQWRIHVPSRFLPGIIIIYLNSFVQPSVLLPHHPCGRFTGLPRNLQIVGTRSSLPEKLGILPAGAGGAPACG